VQETSPGCLTHGDDMAVGLVRGIARDVLKQH
jgi:hypothetical protein